MVPRSLPRRILVVDDDPVVAESLGLILSGNAYDVRIALSAESATTLIDQWTPDIAIVDVLLPRMNGPEFAVVLQTACPGCPVLFFTALPSGMASDEVAKTSCCDFELLEKPVPPSAMLGRIAAVLAMAPGNGGRHPN